MAKIKVAQNLPHPVFPLSVAPNDGISIERIPFSFSSVSITEVFKLEPGECVINWIVCAVGLVSSLIPLNLI